jgi:uncharacterized protein (TIGR02646 family)
MKYINKQECSSWESFTSRFGERLKNKKWEDLKNMSPLVDGVKVHVGRIARRELLKHLWREQKGLCAYCMQSIPGQSFRKISHLEHIKPKRKGQFPELRFKTCNIVMSCNGLNCSSEGAYKDRSHCGAYKDNRNGSGMTFNEALFINPTENPFAEECFSYSPEGEISCTDLGNMFGRKRVLYMIKYLGLDVRYLNDFRRESYESLIEIEIEEGVEFIEEMLQDSSSPAFSFQPMMKRMFGL